jgi:hypothetical protein
MRWMPYLVNLKDRAYRVAGLLPKGHGRLRTADERTYTNFVEASNGVVVGNVATTYPSSTNQGI